MGITLALLAAAAIAVEIQTVTYYLLAVAASLAIGSAFAFYGSAPEVVFLALAISAVGSLPVAHVLRRRFLRPSAAAQALDAEDLGRMVLVNAASSEGLRVSYRGTTWDARLQQPAATPPLPGASLRILGRDGNTLLLGVPESQPATFGDRP